MPDATTQRRENRPAEGFHTAFLPSDPDRAVRMYLPADYQAKYAYPLVVLFHPNGADEDAAATLIPALSRRNYIALCLRGSCQLGPCDTGRPSYGWGEDDPLRDRTVRTALDHACERYHVHSERIYFLGIGEGAAVAYRFGLAMAPEIAGVVALNGSLPTLARRTHLRRKSVQSLRVFVGHGSRNPMIPVTTARKDSHRLTAAGADVRFQAYPTTHRVHPDMLRDANRWIMSAVTEPEAVLPHTT